jgi:hypothetical protein
MEPESTQPAGGGASACAVHAERPAVATCEHCGNFGCGDCIGILDGRRICRNCVTEGRIAPARTPWDERAELGLPGALWKTVVQVSTAPVEFFRRLAPQGGTGNAMFFVLLAAIPAAIVGALQGAALNQAIYSALGVDPMKGISPGDPMFVFIKLMQPGSPVMLGFQVFVGPPAMVLYALVFGLISHLGLLICGGTTQGAETTLKAVLYAVGGTYFWGVVPLLNMFVGLWTLVVVGICLAVVHKAPWWKAVFALLWLPCVCVCGAGVIGGLIGALAAR